MTAFLKNPNDSQGAGAGFCERPELERNSAHDVRPPPCSMPGMPTNALPQRARANINCRIFPGVTAQAVQAKLEELIADPAVKISMPETRGPTASPPPLSPEVMAPIEKLTADFWPGVPVLPILQAGATDGEFTNAVGIPTFGDEPVFLGADLGNIHGTTSTLGVKSLLEGPRIPVSLGESLCGAEIGATAWILMPWVGLPRYMKALGKRAAGRGWSA